MPHSRFSSDEVGRRGEEIYENSVRAAVESEENIGRLVAIDVETGEYAVGDRTLEVGDLIHAKHPDAAVYIKRIGYNAVYAVGGSRHRVTP